MSSEFHRLFFMKYARPFKLISSQTHIDFMSRFRHGDSRRFFLAKFSELCRKRVKQFASHAVKVFVCEFSAAFVRRYASR